MTELRWCVNRMWLTPYFLVYRGCPRCSPALVLYRWMLSSSLAVTSRSSVRWKSSELMVASESCHSHALRPRALPQMQVPQYAVRPATLSVLVRLCNEDPSVSAAEG